MMTYILPDPPSRCRCGHSEFLRLGIETDGHMAWYFMCRECMTLVPVSTLLHT